jgi:hypothetical protein
VGGLLAHHTEGARHETENLESFIDTPLPGLTSIILLALLEELGFSV